MSNSSQPHQLYAETLPEHLTLRDHLARDRTVLANERTLLSYLRTAFALFAAGGTLLKLFPQDQALVVLGIVLSVLGLATTVLGIGRFATTRRNLRRILLAPSAVEADQTPKPPPAPPID